jgi:hypothetical protein
VKDGIYTQTKYQKNQKLLGEADPATLFSNLMSFILVCDLCFSPNNLTRVRGVAIKAKKKERNQIFINLHLTENNKI